MTRGGNDGRMKRPCAGNGICKRFAHWKEIWKGDSEYVPDYSTDDFPVRCPCGDSAGYVRGLRRRRFAHTQGLTGVCMGFSGSGMAGDLQVGLGFRPGFGQQPDPAPESAPEQQPPQPVDAVADHADGPPRPMPRVAVSRRQRLGRRPQATWGNPPVVGVFHSGPIGQGQQRPTHSTPTLPSSSNRVTGMIGRSATTSMSNSAISSFSAIAISPCPSPSS